MLSVTKDFSLDEFEVLALANWKDGAEVLQVPSNPPKYRGALGTEAALVQLILSWARAHPEGALRTYVDPALLEETLGNVCAEAHGLVGLSMAAQIHDKHGTAISRQVALVAAIPFIEAMDAGGDRLRDSAKGRSISLICVKAAKREYLFPLYSNRTAASIRSRSEFSSLLRLIFQTVVPTADRDCFGPNDPAVMGELCYELMKNTDAHATTDAKKNQYKRNVRGMLARYSDVDFDFISHFTAGRSSLTQYFQERVRMTDTRKSLRAFELSIFDAGPGLARRQLGREFSEMTPEEELAATTQCFRFGITTKDSRSSGAGLTFTWRMLRALRGMIRIRTGRYCLYRHFSGNEPDSDFDLWHWDEQHPVLAPVEGLLISIIIPIRA